MSDEAVITQALIAALVNDASLASLMSDGVYRSVPPPNASKVVIVELLDAPEEATFDQDPAYLSWLYLVKAVARNRGPSGDVVNASDVNRAAVRIDAVLRRQPLTAAGFTWSAAYPEQRIESTEIDEVDKTIRWTTRGWHYRIEFTVP